MPTFSSTTKYSTTNSMAQALFCRTRSRICWASSTSVYKIQDFVGVFFAAAQETFVVVDLGWGEAGACRAINYIVGAKDPDWTAGLGLSAVTQIASVGLQTVGRAKSAVDGIRL